MPDGPRIQSEAQPEARSERAHRAPESRPSLRADANEPTPRPTLGDLIHTRRRALNLSLKSLAERVGCAPSYISQVENGRRERPPSEDILRRLEEALALEPGQLVQRAHIERTPADVRKRLETLEGRQRSAERLARLLSHGLGGLGASGRSMLDDAHKTGELQRLVDSLSETDRNAPASSSPKSDAVLTPLSREVPLINKVAAGYPSEFTDLGYPARIADEYVRVPDLSDPDAFAARVVGDSMEPEYHEGDVVIFSPQRDVRDGSDCFVRLEHDAETTFKRVYFERAPRNGGDGNDGDSGDGTASGASGEGAELIRLQPLNSRFAPRTLPREEVAGLYAAVSVTRQIG